MACLCSIPSSPLIDKMLRAMVVVQSKSKASAVICRFWSKSRPAIRLYSRSLEMQSEMTANATVERKELTHAERRKIAEDYNKRRTIYKLEVAKLRKEYAAEVAAYKAADKAEKESKQREISRQALERQRLKNIRSAQNALREEEKRLEQHARFQEHLEKEQLKREARAELYRAAQQMAIQELEKDSVHWMATHEEVEAAFTPEAVQLLWSRSHGVLGSPNPSPDAHFWNHRTHTNRITRSYKSQPQFFLELVLDRIYQDSNNDKKFWTPERLKQTTEIENRARLRSDVQVVGRRELLKKQAQMIEMEYSKDIDGVPQRRPPPSLDVLANKIALEDEGAKILLEDPTKFFVFDEKAKNESQVDSHSQGTSGTYDGPTLGAPIGYRRIGKNEYTTMLGVKYVPTAKTEKEKRQEEREKNLRKAAGGAKATDKADAVAADVPGDDYFEQIPKADYNAVEYDNFHEWEEGVDPNTEEGKAILATPPALRLKDEHVDWVRKQIEIRAEQAEIELKSNVASLQAEARSKMEYDMKKLKEQSPEMEEGIDVQIDRILVSMPAEELLVLSDIDHEYVSSPMSDEEISVAATKVPSLSESQLKLLLERDRTCVPDTPTV